MDFSPASERNKDPIFDIFAPLTKNGDTIVEIGSGTGQHAVFFASKLPHITWQPTDRPGHLESVLARYNTAQLDNLCEPRAFDLLSDDYLAQWPRHQCDIIIAINVLHIAPVEAVDRLFLVAQKRLKPGGVVFVYGPYKYQGRALEPSNEAFDQWLKQRDERSGIRLFEDVDKVAKKAGMILQQDVAMPANNRSIWWQKER